MSEDNKYDEVEKASAPPQPENPLGEATDPAATVGDAVTNPSAVEDAPDPEQAAAPVEDAPDQPTPESGSSDES